jgi:hypothetical protein
MDAEIIGGKGGGAIGMGVWRREEQKEQRRWNEGKWKDGT